LRQRTLQPFNGSIVPGNIGDRHFRLNRHHLMTILHYDKCLSVMWLNLDFAFRRYSAIDRLSSGATLTSLYHAHYGAPPRK
jgi:hypothetical protein